MPVVKVVVPDLHQLGPLMLCKVGVSEGFRRAIKQDQGSPSLKEVEVVMLIDTGAQVTCLTPNAITKLGIHPTGQMDVIGVGAQNGVGVDMYDISLRIGNARIPSLRVACVPLNDRSGIQGLIGRDVLKHGTLFYNGMNSELVLCF